MHRFSVILISVATLWLAPSILAGQAKDEYLPGGPLAGLKLPPFPTQHGEPPGYPGCIPALQAEGKETTEGDVVYRDFGKHGLAPEWELYPGSVEHWREYWFKYTPSRSFFDRQSLLKNFVAPRLPGAKPAQVEEYAEPVYWIPRHANIVDTGRRNRPVPVVRCRVKDPVFTLDFGTLDIGLYVVRVIGCVETRHLRPFLQPLYWRLRVNDGLSGEVSEYRFRSPYNDQFYSIAEIYFHAPERRAYRAELYVDEGSKVEPLVHNVTLDDALAGVAWQRLKMRTTLAADRTPRDQYSESYIGKRAPLTREERWVRDAAIWHGFVPLNKHGNDSWAFYDRKIPEGAAGKTMKEIEVEHGAWEPVAIGQGGREAHVGIFPVDVSHLRALMVNRKLNLVYTVDDLQANRPLPDPYPYKDDGAGLYAPDPADPANGQVFCPISWVVSNRIQSWGHFISGGAQFFRRGEANTDYARDSAIALVRFAYDFPTLDMYRWISHVSVDPAARNRYILRGRQNTAGTWGNFIRFLAPVEQYDALFDYIRGNEDLAHSIGRFVPWVKSSDDVLKLLDVYLVQTMAKRIMRYHYYGDGRQPERMAELATLVGNNAATDPWMEWLFSRAFFYPQPPSGLQDLMITGTDRDGRSPIGSYSYMIGEFSADKVAEKIEDYIRHGGNPRFDLRDNRRYPKTLVSLDFYTRIFTAGLQFPRIGDVAGPDKGYAKGFEVGVAQAQPGWRWTKNPKFAYILKHFGNQADWDAAAWDEIRSAADKVQRAPWMENRSRVLPGWAAFLESGVEHDDFRFRRSVMVRIGTGYGHGHEDTFDLQIYAHGVPMTIDGGQRGGYSSPGDRVSRVHNTVVVDGKNWLGHSWARTLTDANGAGYVCVQAAPLHGTRLFRRQVALLDVDEGRGAPGRLAPAQVGPNPGDLPRDVVTPNSYVLDVFRVAGGDSHTYCFHATVNDPAPAGPQPVTNVANVKLLPDKEAEDEQARQAAALVGGLKNERYYGIAPARLETTFHLQKKRAQQGKIAEAGAEVMFVPRGVYDEKSPDKFTRWHLLNSEGALVAKGDQHCHQWEYYIPLFFVQRRGENLESAFAAIIEPYAGKPFINAARVVDIADNEADALRAVAIEVRTANGHTDLCFADGRPDKIRRCRMENAECKVAAEFAFYSIDDGGLRQVQLTGGTLLDTPAVRIETAARERNGRILRLSYFDKTITIDQPWPPSQRERLLEVGDVRNTGARGYLTAYTATAVRPEGRVATISLLRGADYYRSRIKEVNEREGVVVCVLPPPSASGYLAGIDRQFVASNESLTRFWRADVLPGDRSESSFPFRLTPMPGFERAGAPVTEADFAPEGALRLWEYGVGDEVRQSTFVSLRRLGPRPGTEDTIFELDGDVDVTLGLKAKALEMSPDGQKWQPLAGEAEGGWFRAQVPAAAFAAGPVRLRLR